MVQINDKLYNRQLLRNWRLSHCDVYNSLIISTIIIILWSIQTRDILAPALITTMWHGLLQRQSSTRCDQPSISQSWQTHICHKQTYFHTRIYPQCGAPTLAWQYPNLPLFLCWYKLEKNASVKIGIKKKIEREKVIWGKMRIESFLRRIHGFR